MKVLLIVAPSDFRDEEYFDTKEELEKKGIKVVSASTKKGELTGVLGGRAEASITLPELNVDDYAAIAFIGGGGSSVFFKDQNAWSIARDAKEKGKILAAICIAPTTLANAGVLDGIKATAWPSQEGSLKEHGAIWTGTELEADGKIITANGPGAAKAFGQKIASSLTE